MPQNKGKIKILIVPGKRYAWCYRAYNRFNLVKVSGSLKSER